MSITRVVRISLAIVLAVLLVPPGSIEAVQSASEANLADVAKLVPADATALISINSDVSSDQLIRAQEYLTTAGLDAWFQDTLADLVSASELPASLLDPDQSTLLGGRITLATWGDGDDPVANAALYIQAADSESAWRTAVGLVIGDVLADSIAREIPGGRVAYDEFQSVAVMQFDEVVILAPATSAQVVAQLVLGSEPVLADFKPYQETMGQQEAGSIAVAYVNGPVIGYQLTPLLLNTFGLSFSELGVLLAVTGDLVTAHTSVGLRAGDHGFELRIAQRPAPFVGGPLPPGGARENLAERVSGDTKLFISGRDLGSQPVALQIAEALMTAIIGSTGEFAPYPEGSSEEAGPADIANELRQQILDQLRGDFLIAANVTGVENPSDLSAVLTSELVDPDAIDGQIRLLQLAIESGEQTGISLERETVPGGSFLVLTATEGLTAPVSFRLGVVDGELILALMDGYSALLNPLVGESLSDTESYQSAMDATENPDATTLYLDATASFEMLNADQAQGTQIEMLQGLDLSRYRAVQSLVAQTYAEDDLAISDIRVVIEEPPASVPAGSLNAAPSVGNAEQIEADDLYFLSVSHTGAWALALTSEAVCLIPTDTWTIDDELCSYVESRPDRGRVAWSPDGTAVAFTEEALILFVDSDVHVIDSVNRTVRNLTDDGYEGDLLGDNEPGFRSATVDIGPVWSPGGDQIAFTRTVLTDEPRTTDLVVVDVATGVTSEPTELHGTGFAGWGGTAWTDQGLYIGLYSTDGDDPENGIYQIDPETGVKDRVFKASENQFAIIAQPISTDALLVAYPEVLSQILPGEQCGWAIVNLDSGRSTDVVADGKCSTSVGVSPDGTLLMASMTEGPRLAVIDVASGAWAEVESSALDEIMGDRTVVAGAVQLPGTNVIPWTSDDTIWSTLGAGTLVRIDLVSED